MMSQNLAVLNYLQLGNSITPLTALRLFGILRLGARRYDLCQQGYKIHTEIVRVGKKRVASYSLVC